MLKLVDWAELSSQKKNNNNNRKNLCIDSGKKRKWIFFSLSKGWTKKSSQFREFLDEDIYPGSVLSMITREGQMYETWGWEGVKEGGEEKEDGEQRGPGSVRQAPESVWEEYWGWI